MIWTTKTGCWYYDWKISVLGHQMVWMSSFLSHHHSGSWLHFLPFQDKIGILVRWGTVWRWDDLTRYICQMRGISRRAVILLSYTICSCSFILLFVHTFRRYIRKILKKKKKKVTAFTADYFLSYLMLKHQFIDKQLGWGGGGGLVCPVTSSFSLHHIY